MVYLFIFHSRGIAADQRTILARSSSEISTISCSTICGHSTGASARRCHRRDVGSIPTVRSNSSVDQWQIGALITLKSMVRVHPLGPDYCGVEEPGCPHVSHTHEIGGSNPPSAPKCKMPLWPWWSRRSAEAGDIGVRSLGAAPIRGHRPMAQDLAFPPRR